MKPATHRTALRVQGVLGPRFEVMEFEASTRTAAEAAAAIGCTVGADCQVAGVSDDDKQSTSASHHLRNEPRA